MSAQPTSSMAGGSAVQLLRLASKSANMIPPVKDIVDGALRIGELVLQFKTSQDEWKEFQAYLQSAVATVLHSLASIDNPQSEARGKLEKLQATLGRIVKRIESKQSEPVVWRMIRFLDHPTMIAEMRKEVDDAVSLFKLGATIRMEVTIEKVFELLQQGDKSQATTTTLNATVSKLRRVEGASWHPHRVCLKNTRQNIIETVFSWLDNNDGVGNDKSIFLLTGVAGSGKSAIAHTVAQRCHGNRQLATSFFFDRLTSDRNNPKHLISTIAADLCQVGGQLGRRIQAAIEDNEKVLYAPIPQQFQELVLEPSKGCVSEHPLVIVLDALDEGSNADLLQTLCDDACYLPPSIRIFLTSRPSPDIDVLRRKSHVHSMDLDIYEQGNVDDIALFIPYKLHQVAEYHDLGSGWPDQQLVALFQAKAEGLFLWAATTCEYLKTCDDPTDELKNLVSAIHPSESSAESRMDSLYATILATCNWKSKSFVDSYYRLLGAAIALKTPLTLRALNALYQRVLVPSNPTLRQLSPLLTGLSNDPNMTKPVQLLHQSLRDFLASRAGSPNSPVDHQRFAIVDKSHSQTLALLCLQLMNRELSDKLPGVGYLAKGPSVADIPLVSQGCISDELWYACRFWVDHIQDVELSTLPGIIEQLEGFLGMRLTVWVELMTSHGRYEGICKLREWVNDELYHYPNIPPLLYNANRASELGSLAKHLQWMGRKEEAWIAAQDQVELNRKLAEATCTDAKVALARSLRNLSIYLTDLGYLDEAFHASEEAVTIHRTLKAEGVADFNADLAGSLQRLSVGYSRLGKHEQGLATIQEAVGLQRQLVNGKDAAPESRFELATSLHVLQSDLYHLGRYEEALVASQEAVDIFRERAAEQQGVFVPELAKSLRGLGANLSRLGRYREAEEATQESVHIYRQLDSERLAVFASDFGDSLHNLAHDISDLGRHGEALTIAQEEVDLYRQLASERPVVFTSDLAWSLHSLAYYHTQLGRHEEALRITQETVDLRRQLASERPAVFTPGLADSLHNLSCYLFNLGHHQEAMSVILEAVQLFRPLAADRPAVFTPGLASALRQLALCLSTLDDDQAAVVAMRESVELYRPLAEQYPATYTPKLSAALEDFALYLSYVGADEEAREIRQELGDSSSEEE